MFTRQASWMIIPVFALLGSYSQAQEIHWREDYQSARKEALEKNLPLLIDFHTDSCFWCKQMDMRTFREAPVQEKIAAQWIPLKVHARQNSTLTSALKVRSFPTLVFAGPEGNILGYLEGFMEAPVLLEHLDNYKASSTTPEWMIADYQESSKAIARDEYARALTILRKISQDGKLRPIQIKSNNLILDLERQATERYTRARKLVDDGNKGEALEVLQDLVRNFEGTDAAREGTTLLASMGMKQMNPDSRALAGLNAELLALIRQDYQQGNLASCIERSDLLNTLAPSSTEAREGAVIASQIRENPEAMRTVIDQTSEKIGQMYLGLAEGWIRKGQPQQAIFYLEKTIQSFPGTRHAEMAQIQLARLTGPNIKPVDLRK